MAKAADAFLTGRPYGIRLDFKHKGFALFNYNMNELGDHLPGRLETLPLEDFDAADWKRFRWRILTWRIFRCAGNGLSERKT